MSQSEQLAELLIRWEELRRQGAEPSAEQLCADCPELVTELSQRIRAMRKIESVLGLGKSNSPESEACAPTIDTGTRPLVSSDSSFPTVPDYEIIETLGRGGMGVVYRARQRKLDRAVAVKMLDARLTGTRQLERFRDEARAIARLHHPNIVQIYDVGHVDNVPYFSMEFVSGGNLRSRLDSGPFNIDEAVRVTEQITRAVHLVHLEGFVHRDLKPANILLSADGQPKVTDFGLAKSLIDDSGHTKTGEILGTIGYMAPEQLDHSHGRIGPCTDIYALGSILYEMLTGQQAFASSPVEAFRQTLQEDVPLPRHIRSSVPRDLEAICLKCLEKRVSDRYATAEALADDLRRYLEHKPVSARRISVARRTLKWVKRRPQVSAFILFLIALLAAWPVIAVIGEHRKSAVQRAEAVRLAPQAREILLRNCFACHGADPENVSRDLDVLKRDILLDADRRIVVPGHPGDSRLVQRIADGSMPPVDEETRLPRLAAKEVDILEKWILGGAPKFPAEDPANPTAPVVEFSQIALEAEEVLQEYCYDCHRHDRADGGIRILHHRLLLDVRKVVVPGNSAESELFQLLVSEPAHSGESPSLEATEKVRRWIDDGAQPFPQSRE